MTGPRGARAGGEADAPAPDAPAHASQWPGGGNPSRPLRGIMWAANAARVRGECGGNRASGDANIAGILPEFRKWSSVYAGLFARGLFACGPFACGLFACGL